MPYPEQFVAPMREELTRFGVEELRTAPSVDEAVQQDGTTMIVVNSVCGCAAGKARPGIAMALLQKRAQAAARRHCVRRRRYSRPPSGRREYMAHLSAVVAVQWRSSATAAGVHDAGRDIATRDAMAIAAHL
jgi:hypothetical protein